MQTYAEHFDNKLKDAKERIASADKTVREDLFRTYIDLGIAIKNLEEAQEILQRVSATAFDRVMEKTKVNLPT